MGQVLLVEDDPFVRLAFAKALRTSGFALDTASDATEALQKVREGGFDAVVSDINLPGLSGIEFLRAVRDEYQDLPVVLVTGGPALESAIRAVEYGAYRYLTKPVDVDALTTTVKGAVQAGQRARELRAGANVLPSSPELGAEEIDHARSFEDTLAQLWVGFQPIVDWGERRLHGYEALVRSDGPFPRPEEIIAAAERLGRVAELGRIIRSRIAAQVAARSPEGLLYVKLHTLDLEDPDLLDRASPLSHIAGRVVLEMTERMALKEIPDVAARVERLRDMGFRVAVEDLGAGFAGLTSFASIAPDLVKLDMSLIRGVDVSPLRQSVIRSLVSLAKELEIRVIAEGVELAAERDTLLLLGCRLFQGYLFGKAERAFSQPRM